MKQPLFIQAKSTMTHFGKSEANFRNDFLKVVSEDVKAVESSSPAKTNLGNKLSS